MTIQYTFAQKATSKKKPGVAKHKIALRNPLEQHTSKMISQISSTNAIKLWHKKRIQPKCSLLFQWKQSETIICAIFFNEHQDPRRLSRLLFFTRNYWILNRSTESTYVMCAFVCCVFNPFFPSHFSEFAGRDAYKLCKIKSDVCTDSMINRLSFPFYFVSATSNGKYRNTKKKMKRRRENKSECEKSTKKNTASISSPAHTHTIIISVPFILLWFPFFIPPTF